MNITGSSFERFKKFVGNKKKEKSSVISKLLIVALKNLENKTDWRASTIKFLKRKLSSVTSSLSARAILEAQNFNGKSPQTPPSGEMLENLTSLAALTSKKTPAMPLSSKEQILFVNRVLNPLEYLLELLSSRTRLLPKLEETLKKASTVNFQSR